MMKLKGTVLLILAMLAAPALACGFPLPAGTAMLAAGKATCAQGEAIATCQARQDAYQMMSKLRSAAVQDLTMDLYIDDGTEVISARMTGSYEYLVTGEDSGLGANIHAVVADGQVDTGDGNPQSLTGMEFIIYGNKAYSSMDGGQTWGYEELDSSALSGIGMLLGLGGTRGAALNLFADSAVFSVTIGPTVQIDGQMMEVQTLKLDLPKLLANADAMTRLLQQGTSASDLLDLSPEDLQTFDPQQIALMSALLLPLMQGTEFSTTLYIGQDDGYIHRIEDNYVLVMDLAKLDAQSKPVKMSYLLSGTITQHNAPLVITEPSNATEGQGIFGQEGGVFGGSGLGSSIFGGGPAGQ